MGTTEVGTSAVVGVNNDIVRQTGQNFDGFQNVDWNQAGKSALVSAAAGGAGYAVGGALAGSKWFTVNGVGKSMLWDATVSSINTTANSLANGINPCTGQRLNQPQQNLQNQNLNINYENRMCR
jgi:hypothetical protein